MILIYIKNHTARSQFVFEFIFKEQFGIVFKTTSDIATFENYSSIKINYSSHPLQSGYFIYNMGLLADDSLRKVTVTIGEVQGLKVLFPSEKCGLGFDLFAATFYMLSRYEEYLPFTEDKFGRFQSKDSLAFINQFLEIPIIDGGINLLAEFLNFKLNSSKFRAILTYDIDVAYKFRGRSIARNLGSIFKDILKMNFSNIFQRIQVFLKIQIDPWDMYAELKESLVKNELKSIFFFLVGENAVYDRNINHKSTAMINLIKEINDYTEVGLHPSFASNRSTEKLRVEKQHLENILGERVSKSRQHYLKLQFPRTYFNLLSAGITEDYSMGFPDRAGFRAGTCKPFYFYDLKNEAVTNLRVFPITCMEVTFMHYEKLAPEKALMKILELLQTVKKYEGTFISIWHNENLSSSRNCQAWKNVHEQMIRKINFYLKK